MSSDGIATLAVTIPFATLFGLFVGSFLNVVIYRTPLGLSVATPRSFCPTCDRRLAGWENIPVVSWLALRGRCHTCHRPISVRYPLVELGTAAAFALVTWGWHGTIVAATYCVLVATVIAVSLIEYGGQRSPLAVAAVGTWVGLLIIVVGAGWREQWHIVVGSLVGTAVAVVVYVVLRRMDADADDNRGHGRSALLIAGCWLGGLGPRPALVGAVVGAVVYGACLVGFRSLVPSTSGRGPHMEAARLRIHPLVAAPLVTSIVAALAASLYFGA